MRIKSIKLDADENPTKVTAELTLDELIFLAKTTGKMSPVTAEESVPGYGGASGEIHNAVTGAVFNRFWDDGVDGAIRDDCCSA